MPGPANRIGANILTLSKAPIPIFAGVALLMAGSCSPPDLACFAGTTFPGSRWQPFQPLLPAPHATFRQRRPAAMHGGFWGPAEAARQFEHAVSPLDPNLMLASCDMSGNYISRDGGDTWRMFNLRGQAHAFTFDPSNPKVIYALANGIYRSEDAGDTWGIVLTGGVFPERHPVRR